MPANSPRPGAAPSLADLYRINERNLALRRQFIGLGPDDVKVLRGLAGWAERVADRLAHDFYTSQFAFEPTRTFFEGHARTHGLTLDTLRPRLEKTQAGYFRDIFREAAGAGEFGVAYFSRRLAIGRMHNVINLPQKWYMGSYPLYRELVHTYLVRSYPLAFRRRARAERALAAVFSLDQQAVSDAFFYDYLQSIGFDLMAVAVPNPAHDLSEHYADLKEGVRQTLVEAARTSARLMDLGEHLRAASELAGTATREITSAMGQVAQGAQDQAVAATGSSGSVDALSRVIDRVHVGAVDTRSSVAEAATAVGSLSGAIDAASDASGQVGEVARSAAEAASRGAAAVGQARDGMVRIQATVADSSARVAELGAKSEQIGAIVEVIDDIADQTNLLALNAAIEAARAGEMGKGFAVVADEVRKLAERSGQATKEIAALIAEVQAVTKAAVDAMALGGREVESGVLLARQSEEALADIRAGVVRTTETVGQITQAVGSMRTSARTVVAAMDRIEALAVANAEGADEMAGHSGGVVNAVGSIAAVSEENSAAAEEVLASTATMADQMEGVAASSRTLVELATTLGTLMDQFDLGDIAVEPAAAPPIPIGRRRVA